MSFEQILFYIFATVAVVGALRMITTPNPVHAALYLVLTFFNVALVWILLEAEFLGLLLILVYVGAVMILFLFVVMMLDINTAPMREGFVRNLPVGLFVALLMIVEIALVVGPRFFGLEVVSSPAPRPEGYSNTGAIGEVLYTEYVYAFEIAAVILLAAIVAAIGLTLRRRKGVKYQDIGRQLDVRREDRVRMVRMDAEKQQD